MDCWIIKAPRLMRFEIRAITVIKFQHSQYDNR